MVAAPFIHVKIVIEVIINKNREEFKMKKIISILIIAVLCSSIWACSSKEEKEEEQTDSVQALSKFSSFPDSMSGFSAVDLEGNAVTNDIFSQADLTVVNFWGTYCGPCINEMPGLAEWAESMPDNVQLIGIVVDAASEDSDEYAAAQLIVDETGVKYENLVVTEGLEDIIGELIGVPTTFFVDRDGNIVGDPIVGANINGYKQTVEEYLDGQE